MKKIILIIAMLASLVGASIAQASTTTQHCSDSPKQYRINISVHGMSCTHGKFIAAKSVRLTSSGEITIHHRRVKGGYEAVSYFDGWTRVEFQPTNSGSSYVKIVRGDVWVKYIALP
jgi:hypothetical protein